jgi:transposase
MPDDQEQRECPLCGATMYLKETETVSQIPGNPKPTTRSHREWICSDCDNFEEADDD